MHFSTLLVSAAAVVSVASAQGYTDAPITYGNSPSVVYEATIQSANVQYAHLNFTGTTNGTGVYVQACFSGISAEQPGPYPYHVHVNPIPDNLNCTAAGGHLDPYMRTDTPPCDSSQPQTCEVGDLSGKYGKVPVTANTETVCVAYTDLYLSLNEGDPAFIGNSRSIVIHNVNLTRIGCGNITLASSTPVPTGNYTQAPVPTPTGGAGKIGASGFFLSMLVAGGLLLL
ncbi:hypothetical protein ABW19_dt0207884 [Dactylella cylindrospora]|nr:hypothetical protein ABW19_dt0207884 [Dactylella cylindrospora]